MSDSSSNSSDNDGDRTDEAPQGQLSALRSLIVGPTDHRLERMTKQLENPEERAHAVSGVLPRAVTLRDARDNQLSSALEPVLENAIIASIKKDRQILVNALSPVIGPAIRKAIANSLQGLIQNFNQILEHSFSVKGLRWRLEALRTRRPFAEVVLLNTLVYQVEQVFLIQRESGLLIQHVVAKTAVAQNPDLVSGMLTAIKDFVQDSFGTVQGDTLDTFQVGECKIWIEHGTHALLAMVIRGNPPADLHRMMGDALDEIHLKQSDPLSSFNGDSDAFETCRPILNGLLQVELMNGEGKSASRAWMAVALVVLLAGWAIFMLTADARRWGHFADRLEAQPGIVVTRMNKQDGRRHVYGLKDPYATDPSTMVVPAGLPPESVIFHWEPYQSAHPEFAHRRLTALFHPPATIHMTFEQGTLQLSGSALHQWIEDTRRISGIVPWIDHFGDQELIDIDIRLDRPSGVTLALDGSTLRAGGSASHAWILQARDAAAGLPGVGDYDDSRLVDIDEQAWESVSQTIVDTVFYFEAGGNRLTEGQENDLQQFIGAVNRLVTLSQLLDRNLRIDVIGHADSSGDTAFNLAISRQRASRIANFLIAAGVDPVFVTIHAAGSQVPAGTGSGEAIRASDRRVVFKIHPTDR